MPPQINPYILEAAGEVLRFAVKEWTKNRANTIDALGVRVLPPTPPSEATGCPYCEIATSMAAAHLYLWRATDRPELIRVYVELARTRIDDAMELAKDLPLDLSRGQIASRVRELADALVVCPDAAACRDVARNMWATSMLALRYAEHQQHDGQASLPGEAPSGPTGEAGRA